MKNNENEGIQMTLKSPKGDPIWEKLSKSDQIEKHTTTLSNLPLKSKIR